MNCTICNKPIILIPSATERARKYGGKPSGYTRLFTTHTDCQLAKNKADLSDLIKRHYTPDP
jgi:hypothetical protein